jgi:hypothetical protein
MKWRESECLKFRAGTRSALVPLMTVILLAGASTLYQPSVAEAASRVPGAPRASQAPSASAVTPSEVRDALQANTNQRLLPVCAQTTGPHCGVLAESDGAGHPQWSKSPVGFGATDLESAYGVSGEVQDQGYGNTVALVEAYDDANAESDMNFYRSEYGLPSCTSSSGCFEKLNESGQTSPLAPSEPANSGWAEETSLDLDMIATACPYCNIDLVEGNSPGTQDLYAAEGVAASLHPIVVSNSWEGSEYSGEATNDQLFSSTSTTFVFSSGDYKYAKGAQYPGSSPNVVSVGGTILQTAPGTARGWSESAWPGTSSGCSKYESRPTWQPSSLAPSCPNARVDADISAVAQGVAVYDTARSTVQKVLHSGGWEELAGTSVAAPLVAGLIALNGSAIHPQDLYSQSPSDFNDVTTGHNGSCGKSSKSTYVLCNAGPGWDGPTGLGTPVGTAPFQTSESACSDPGPNSGTLTSNPISLGDNPTLTFDTLWQIEGVDPSSYDLMDVNIIPVGGSSTTVWQLNPSFDGGSCQDSYDSGRIPTVAATDRS